jgi:hypothetical protein
MTEQTINNKKIDTYYTNKIYVKELQARIEVKKIELNDKIYELGSKKFSYDTQNYYKRNVDFIKINWLNEEIYREQQMLNRQIILLEESEEKAKGLKWIV